jgi:tetratricopeptide (TPR) repeat protein
MGHFPYFYVLVPEENLTEGRWHTTTRLLGMVRDSEVTEFTTSTPDEPVHVDSEGRFNLDKGDLDILFDSISGEELQEEIHWPTPEGLAYITGYIDSKWAPRDSDEAEAIMAAMRAVFAGMGGVFANVANELGYDEVMTFEQFMKCQEGYLIFSRELVDLVGMDRLEAAGMTMEFGDGVELRTWTPWVPEGAYSRDVMESWADENEIIDDLLEQAEVLESEGMLRPDFDIAEIGTTLEPRFTANEGAYEKRKREAAKDPPPDLYAVDIPEWSRQVADVGIRARDDNAIKALQTKLDKLVSVGDMEGQRDVLRQMVRLQWSLQGGVGKKSVVTCNRLAGILLELGDFKEAEMLMRSVTEYQHGAGEQVQSTSADYYARSLREQGMLEDAAAMYEWGIQATFPELGFREWDAGYMLADLAMVYAEMGEVEKAEAALERSRPIAAFTRIDEPGVMSKWLGAEALVAKARGDLETAEDVARRGVNYSWSTEYVSAKDLDFNLSVLSRVLEARGDAEGAERVKQQARDLRQSMTKKDYIETHGPPAL